MDAPTRLGRYSLLKKLAAGSALETHLARRATDTDAGGEVVLRKLRPKVAKNEEAVAVFRREIERAVGLDQANLGRVFEMVSTPAAEHAIAVEFVWGEDLRRIAERGMTVGRFMPIEIAVRIGIEVAEALSYLHDRRDAAGAALSLVHGHVAPANILLGFGGAVKLVNFGIASAEAQIAEAIGARRRQLKYAYMSPEQVEGGDLDARSDLFSLGTVLYEYTTRKRLFKGSDEVSTMKLVSEADIKAPSESIPSYPPALERVVIKALCKDRDSRYQTAIELRDDLLEFLDESGLEADTTDLVGYMTGIFPDRIKEYEKLLGEGYSGPRANLWAEIEAEIASRPHEAVPEPETTAPAGPRPVSGAEPAAEAKTGGPAMPDVDLPPLPDSKAGPPDGSEAETAPKPGPPPVPPRRAPEEEKTPASGEYAVEAAEMAGEDEEEVGFPPADEDEEPGEPSGPSLIPLPAGVQFQDAGDERAPERAMPMPELLRPKESDTNVITAVHTLRKDVPDAFEEAAERSRTVVKAVGVAMVIALGFIVWYGMTYHWPWQDIEPVPDRPDVEPRPQPTFPETMGIEVHSEPPGAAVSVNGVIAEARTPGTFGVVPDWPNTLVFYMDGFETRVLDVEIGAQPPPEGLAVSLAELVQPPDWEPPPPDPNSDMPPITEWAPPRGRINVMTEPAGATILLNGRDVCRAQCEFEVIADQEQHLTARLNGYLDTVALTTAFSWDAENDTRFLRLTMRRAPPGGQRYSYMELNSTPAGARVRVDGASSGRTQLNAPLRIEEVYRVALEPPPNEPDYHPWARTFYPVPGRWLVSPIMQRIRRDPAQLSLFIDTPGLEGTVIYMGPNEIGVGAVEVLEIDSGTYELTLSYTPPTDSGAPRRRSVVEVDLPMGRHITAHYGWDGERFALVEQTDGPLVERDEDD